MARREVTAGHESRVISIMELPRLELPQKDVIQSATIRKAVLGVKLNTETCNSNEDLEFGEQALGS